MCQKVVQEEENEDKKGSKAENSGSFALALQGLHPLQAGAQSKPKLGAAGRKKLEEQLLRHYPSERLTDEERPSEKLLELYWEQQRDKEYRWVPWKQLLSQAHADEVKSGRRAKGSGESRLLQLMAEANGLEEEEGEE